MGIPTGGKTPEMSGHGETITSPQRFPTMHEPVPMGSVKTPEHYHNEPHELWGGGWATWGRGNLGLSTCFSQIIVIGRDVVV